MKKIGFVDYYISEWHANNYPAWIKAACERLGLEYEVAYAWAEIETSLIDGKTTDQWCEEMGITRCATVDELCEKSDYIMVLAPSCPETHLRLAEATLKYGKRTYIDKTFAPDLETAKKIFALGEQYNAPFFSSSALRYAEELDAFKGGDQFLLTGGGRDFAEYIIHPIEMCVKLFESPAKKVKVEAVGAQRFCHVVAENGKEAMLLYSPALFGTVSGMTADGQPMYKACESDLFGHLLESVLLFFENGTIPFDPAQTLEVMRVRDALLKGETMDNQWIEV